MIQKFIDDYANSWKKSLSDFPFSGQQFTRSEKEAREKILDRYMDSVKALKNKHRKGWKLTTAEEDGFFTNTQNFMRQGLDFSDQQLKVMFSDEFREVTRQFVRKARQFDSALTFHDIFQALRNAWIMNGLQIVLGLPVQLTPSIFAYSMLYPYTDNLIDNPDISAVDKLIFSNNFYSRLAGQNCTPGNSTEEIIFSLVAMIEEEFPRSTHPEVYNSLIAIHEAQTCSLQLIHDGNSLSESETLKICLGKGGASVLADGYLVSGKLSKNQEYFLFGYGAYLQLLDDIQDAEEDQTSRVQTLFSGSFDSLEEKLNKTYWFGGQVMQNLSLFGAHHLEVFKSLMRKSMDLFIIEAVAQNPEFYSRNYAAEIEKYSPFSFSYIQKQKEQFAPYNGFLLTAIQQIAFNEYIPAKKVKTVVCEELQLPIG